MSKNMGTVDRTLRVIVSIILAVLYLTGTVEGTLGIVLLIVGAVMLLTSFVGFCPAYLPLGLNTCKKDE